jgi:hypothetical protein
MLTEREIHAGSREELILYSGRRPIVDRIEVRRKAYSDAVAGVEVAEDESAAMKIDHDWRLRPAPEAIEAHRNRATWSFNHTIFDVRPDLNGIPAGGETRASLPATTPRPPRRRRIWERLINAGTRSAA